MLREGLGKLNPHAKSASSFPVAGFLKLVSVLNFRTLRTQALNLKPYKHYIGPEPYRSREP